MWSGGNCVSVLQLATGGLQRGARMGQGRTVAILPTADCVGGTLCLHLLTTSSGGTLPAGDTLVG